MRISLKGIFTRHKDGRNGEAVSSEGRHETPDRSKMKKVNFPLILIGLAIVAGTVSYHYFSGTFSDYFGYPKDTARQDPFSESGRPGRQAAQSAGYSGGAALQTQANANSSPGYVSQSVSTPAKDGKANKNLTATQSSDVKKADDSPRSRLYIPAKDILSNSTSNKQHYEDEAATLKAQVEAQKFRNELSKSLEDAKMIPVQSKVHLSEMSGKIAEKSYQPVIAEKPVIPPALIAIQKVGDELIASFSVASGENVSAGYARGRAGDTIGEFKIQAIANDNVVLSRDNKTYPVFMKLPDKYPVSQPLFGGGRSGPAVASPSTQTMIMPSGIQPVPIPVTPAPPIPSMPMGR